MASDRSALPRTGPKGSKAEWQTCRDCWKGWSGLSATWSCCLQSSTGPRAWWGRKSVSGGVAPSVEAFDKLRNSMVAEFLKNSRILAGDIETRAERVLRGFPSDGVSRPTTPREGMAAFLKPITEKI